MHFSWYDLPFNFLFKNWNISTTTELALTCLAVFSVAVMIEGLRVLTVVVHKKFYVLPISPIPSDHNMGIEDSMESLTQSINVTDSLNYVKEKRIHNHCFQSLLHLFKVIQTYGLMLAAMTYNGYIFISFLLGATIGYFIFCHNIPILERETCENKPLTKSTTIASSCTNSTGPSLLVEEI